MDEKAPMTASVANVALRTSVSNHLSRMGLAAPVNNSIASGRESPRDFSVDCIFQAFFMSLSFLKKPIFRSPLETGHTSGAVCDKVGSSTAATFSSSAS